MPTILHIVKKDLRVGGSSILIFLAMLALGVLAQSPALPADALLTQIGRNLLPMITLLVLLSCVVMAVLEDPVAGTNAFWMTRPARARTLLGAKALLLGSMVITYLAGQAIILWMHGGIHLTPYLLGGFAVGTLPLMAVVFAAAAMASDPTRFFVTAAIGLAASGVLMVVAHSILALFLPGVTLWPGEEATLFASARLGIGALALLVALGLAWHQYATRRTARTGVLAGFAALLLAGLFVTWSIDFFRKPPVDAEGEAALGLDRFQPSLQADKAHRVRSIHEDVIGGESVRILLNVPVSTADLPEGWVLRRMRGTARLTTAEGKTFETAVSATLQGQERGLHGPAGFRLAGRDVASPHDADLTIALLDLPEAEFHALGETILTGTVELSLSVARREVVMELPLAAGAAVRRNGETWSLLSQRPAIATTSTAVGGSIEHRETLGGLAVELDVCAPDLWLRQTDGGKRPPHYLNDGRVLLLNRGRKEWMRRGGGGASVNGGQPGIPVTRSLGSLNFDTSGGIETAWLDGATLGITGDSNESTLRRSLRVEGIRVTQD